MNYRVNQEINDICFWSNESISELEQIVSVLGVFEDKPGKVNSRQVVNNQVKMGIFC